jgi:DNA-binding transcriptional LysR family regulator
MQSRDGRAIDWPTMYLDLDHVEAFLAVADHGTVTAAAKALHMTQPAVSRTLKLLEDSLGVSLFDRSGRAVALNATGRALVPRARAMIDEAVALRRDLVKVGQRRYHDVRIGTVDSVATFLLPNALAGLRDRYPELEVKLYSARTAELLRRLGDGLLDLAIVAFSGEPPVERTLPIGRYELVFHGLAERFPTLAEVTDEAALHAFPLIQLESHRGQPTLVDKEHSAGTFAIASSLASVKALVLAGFGVGALLDFMLTPAERARLVTAQVAHDPDCQLHIAFGPLWDGLVERRIAATLADLLRRP